MHKRWIIKLNYLRTIKETRKLVTFQNSTQWLQQILSNIQDEKKKTGKKQNKKTPVMSYEYHPRTEEKSH